MRYTFLVFSVMIGMFLFLAPSMSSIYATHNLKDKSEVRKQSESQKINSEQNQKFQNIKETFQNFKEAFIAWKTIKETWKSVKNSGNTDSISQTKKLLDDAILVKDKAWQKYVDVRNSN